MRTLEVRCAHARVLILLAGPVIAVCLLLGLETGVSAQIAAQPSNQSAQLVFFNRPIVVLRAQVLGRGPAERVDAAKRVLDDLAHQGISGPIEARPFNGAAIITVASRGVVALAAPDVDELSGESVEGAAAQAISRLQVALAEAAEARAPGRLLRSSAATAAVALLAIILLWGITRAHRAISGRVVAIAEATVERSGIADVTYLRASRLLDLERWLISATAAVLDAAVVYGTVSFALRRFPYTRPWGEAMRGFFLARAETLGLGVAQAIPGLLTVAIIAVIVRFCSRLIALWFGAIEAGRLKPRWIYPETAQPTRRLVTGLLWMFAAVVAYPYLPGSQTDAFKGVSVFLGLIITFGSSGLVNQIMSGFVMTYSRALRLGDFVRIGDVEGVVTHLGALSTKIKTLQYEEVTIPNAVVVAQTTTDFSRFSEPERVLTPTSVTIGYDAPWRQVQSLMLLAAERTPGVRRQPQPIVIQAGLEDFYVRYTLLVSLERQESRLLTLHTLHAHIQDLFNEYGVQIMSPNYVFDPSEPKLVARKNWYAAPAEQDPQRSATAARTNP